MSYKEFKDRITWSLSVLKACMWCVRTKGTIIDNSHSSQSSTHSPHMTRSTTIQTAAANHGCSQHWNTGALCYLTWPSGDSAAHWDDLKKQRITLRQVVILQNVIILHWLTHWPLRNVKCVDRHTIWTDKDDAPYTRPSDNRCSRF